MKPNGMRAWRKANKAFRRKLNRQRPGYRLAPIRGRFGRRHYREGAPLNNGIHPRPAPLPVVEFSPRSLVGMSQRRRKVLAWLLWSTEPGSYEFAKSGYRLGERLRPCPGCADCSADLLGWMSICDGSGVLPAKRHRRCGWWLNTRTAKNATQRCGMPTTDGWLDCQNCGGSGWLPARGE